MQQFDQAPVEADAIESSLATIVQGSTAPSAFSVGKYIYVKHNGTLDPGLYRVKSAIAQGDTLSSSNLEQDSEGVVNALNSNIAPLLGNTKWADWTEVTSFTNGEAWDHTCYCKIGKVTYLNVSVKGLTANTSQNLFTLPTGHRPLFSVEYDGFGGLAYLNHAHFKVIGAGVVSVYSSDTYATGFIAFPSV